VRERGEQLIHDLEGEVENKGNVHKCVRYLCSRDRDHDHFIRRLVQSFVT